MSDPVNLVTIPLETPIARGETPIDSVRLRRPKAGDLRGLSIAKLHMMDYNEIRTLLPRITIPPLTDVDIDQIDPADLTEVTDVLSDFLLTKRRRAELLTT